MSNSTKEKIGILWFRNDLRLNDNTILNKAIDLISNKKLDKIIPFYCYDKNILEGKSQQTQLPRCGPLRRNFLIESVQDLRNNFVAKLNSDLYLSYGDSDQEILKLIEFIQNKNELALVDLVITSKDVPYEEIELVKKLKQRLDEKKISLMLVWDLTMIHLDDLPIQNLEKFPDQFTQFRKLVEIRGDSNYNVRSPVLIKSNYSLPTYNLSLKEWNDEINPLLPTVLEINTDLSRSAIKGMKGGETEALNRTTNYFFKSNGLENYKSTRNGLIGESYSSKLSMWLSLGCVSARYLYSKVKEYEEKFKQNESTKAFVFELLWRDFFKFHSFKHGKKIFHLNGLNLPMRNSNRPMSGASNYSFTYEWKTDKNLFEKWCNGDTGYPFVDSNMKELKETGWMSNRGRQNVASFLTKDLGIDWRYGAEYFEMTLVDYDCTSNWGNWQYVAGVGTDPRTDRYFNVIKQAYDYDENGEFVKLWLPQLKQVSTDFVHCPFRMSLTDQKRFNCTIGKDYPAPVVRMKFEWNPSQRNKVNKFAANAKKKNF